MNIDPRDVVDYILVKAFDDYHPDVFAARAAYETAYSAANEVTRKELNDVQFVGLYIAIKKRVSEGWILYGSPVQSSHYMLQPMVKLRPAGPPPPPPPPPIGGSRKNRNTRRRR